MILHKGIGVAAQVALICGRWGIIWTWVGVLVRCVRYQRNKGTMEYVPVLRREESIAGSYTA